MIYPNIKKAIIPVSIAVLTSCNTAQFSERRGPKQLAKIEAMSCSVSPKVVLPGEKVRVSISGGSNYSGRFEQVLSGPLSDSQMVIKENGVFGLQSGLANEYVINKQGNYTVTLKELDYNAGIGTSCSFKVYKECPVGTERVGANVAFILDNSGSHGKSDCPGSKEIKLDNGLVSYQCDAETDREKAVKYAVSILGKVGEKGGKATSYVSSASFPSKTDPIAGYNLGASGWVNPSSSSSALAKDLLITRKPFGMTPYGEGLSAATSLFDKSKDSSKSSVAIFVTDGFPTDKAPYVTLNKAKELKARGVKIVTVMVSDGSESSLVSSHKEFLKGLGSDSNPWYSQEYYSYDDYFSELLGNGSTGGLLQKMSDKVVYVNKTSELTNAFESIIGEQAISCE